MDGKFVRIERFERIPFPHTPTEQAESEGLGIRSDERQEPIPDWLSRECYKAAMLRAEIYDKWAADILSYDQGVRVRPSRWARMRRWLAAHWPRIHLGPCDHSDCY